MKALTIAVALLALALVGCKDEVRYRTKPVPVRITCIATVPAKPARLTPCPAEITDSQCVKRSRIDIERLQSAVDQLTELVEACQ